MKTRILFLLSVGVLSIHLANAAPANPPAGGNSNPPAINTNGNTVVQTGLSTGVKVGIGVGVTAGVAAAASVGGSNKSKNTPATTTP